jgi:hypothetical protein
MKTKHKILIILGLCILGYCAIKTLDWIGEQQAIIKGDTYKTTLVVKNTYTQPVLTYLTLGGCDNCLSDVNGVFGITTSGLQGSFTLQPGDSVYYTPPEGVAFEGNISFLAAPVNCPVGTTLCEFVLNNYVYPDTMGQETVEISCVAGVSYIAKYTMKGGGSWTATTGYENITCFWNDTIGANSGLVGVYPYGCDDCTTQSSQAPSCTIGKNEPCQVLPICNISRNSMQCGGFVTIEYIKPISQ